MSSPPSTPSDTPPAPPGVARPDVKTRLASVIAMQNDLAVGEQELQATLTLVADQARRLCGAAGAVVELAEGEELVYRAAVGEAEQLLGTRLPLRGSFSGAAMSSLSGLRCDDALTDTRVHRVFLHRLNARSMAAVPLRRAGRALGVLKVHAPVPRAFDDEDVELLELMSGVISAAVVRASETEARQQLLVERERAAQEREQANRAREEALAALEESQAILRTFFNTAPFYMGLVQLEGEDLRHLEANPATLAMLGRSHAEVVGRLFRDAGTPPEALPAVLAAFHEARRTGRTAHGSYERRVGNELRRHLLMASPVPGNTQRAHPWLCYCVVDVTGHELLRQRAERSERLASLGRLAAGVAHVVNNPLTTVLTNLGFLGEGLELLAGGPHAARLEELRAALRDAHEGAERVRLLVRDLHAFARPEEESRGTARLEAALERALLTTANELRHRARVVRDFRATPPVRGSESRLSQVFLNLLLNAAQSLPSGRAELHEVRVSTGTLADGRAFAEVRTPGAGIPPDVLAHLFDPFSPAQALGEGMGLGLSISHQVVTSLGGELQAESHPDSGSTLRVLLPPAPAEAPAVTAPPPPAPAPRRGRVLVVDDDGGVGRAVARALRRTHDVVYQPDAKVALAELRDGARFDAILCDVMMPDMGGEEFHQELLVDAPRMAERLVFCTGGIFAEEASQAVQLAGRPVLEKPFELEALEAILAPLLQQPCDG